MSLIIPAKCKICGSTLKPPDEALIIGEDPVIAGRRYFQRLVKHLAERHQEHMAAAVLMGNNLCGILIGANFELSGDLAQAQEQERANIHRMTGKVRMTDEDLKPLAYNTDFEDDLDIGLFEIFKDLRDRYEEIGQYAVKPVEQPEPVTP